LKLGEINLGEKKDNEIKEKENEINFDKKEKNEIKIENEEQKNEIKEEKNINVNIIQENDIEQKRSSDIIIKNK